MNTNIVILAAGPPKPGRNRHLEIYNNRPLILNIIETCNFSNCKLFIVINKNNLKLKEYLKNLNYDFTILYPATEKYIDTLKISLSQKGNCILIMGDLVNLNKEDVNKFILTKYKSAICRYKQRWGENLKSKEKKLVRRSDMGDAIFKISEEHKEYYLSDINIDLSKYYFKLFYPNQNIDENIQNHLGTHINYSFFFNIWSNPKINDFEDKGTIFYDKIVYEDND